MQKSKNNKKIVVISLLCFCLISIQTIAQEEFSAKNKFEISLTHSLQRPFMAGNIADLLYTKRSLRMRNSFGLGVRYYAFEKWFLAYQLSYSQEGGGYREAPTNLNFFKNGFHIGYSAKQSRKVIFEIFTGLEWNVVLSAKHQNAETVKKEKVENYFKPTYIGVPLGIGLKTKIANNTYASMHTIGSIGLSNLSDVNTTKTYQFISPGFRFNVSKFIQ